MTMLEHSPEYSDKILELYSKEEIENVEFVDEEKYCFIEWRPAMYGDVAFHQFGGHPHPVQARAGHGLRMPNGLEWALSWYFWE